MRNEMSEPRFFPPQNALVEQILKEKYSPKIAPEFLYVWARRETEIISTTKEPNYIHLSPKERGESWFPITEEDFNKATDEIKRIGHKVGYGSIFQKPTLTEGEYLIYGNLVRVAKLGFNFTNEVHRYIGISTEPIKMENAKSLASKLGLPSPFA